MSSCSEVTFECPKCGSTIEVQSRSGVSYERHSSKAVPLTVMPGLDKEVYCGSCEAAWLIVQLQEMVQLTLAAVP